MHKTCSCFAIELQGKRCESACAVCLCNKRLLPCTSQPLRGHGCAGCNRFRRSRDLCSSGRCSIVDRLVPQTRSLAKFSRMNGPCYAQIKLISETEVKSHIAISVFWRDIAMHVQRDVYEKKPNICFASLLEDTLSHAFFDQPTPLASGHAT